MKMQKTTTLWNGVKVIVPADTQISENMTKRKEFIRKKGDYSNSSLSALLHAKFSQLIE